MSMGEAAPLVVVVVVALIVGGGSRPRADEQPAPGRGGQTRVTPPTARAAAPVDLTGPWVSIVTEDWRFRMVTPPKGDYSSLPLTDEGRRVADTWDESKDGACEAYGVGGLMRIPGRLRISWQDDNTLKIESDAGQQTRLLQFGAAAPSGPPTLQGVSTASWERPPAGGGVAAPVRWAPLKVVTTQMRPGWLRRNGVPYSNVATITEYFTRFTHPQAGDWFVVTTVVEDPRYLQQPFITSSNFKREPGDAIWNPVPCKGQG
jgi:hypothetical protein